MPPIQGEGGMDDAMKPNLKFRIDTAVMFTNSKGRMPWDVHELREWLREYAWAETQRAEKAMELYTEHLNICTIPNVIARQMP
jgi:hypothetical protein